MINTLNFAVTTYRTDVLAVLNVQLSLQNTQTAPQSFIQKIRFIADSSLEIEEG
jgi:hypothetical protein